MSSNDIAVSVRGLSKSYTIAHNAEKHTRLTEAIMHRLKHPIQRQEKETFWALKDVEFNIKKGNVVGIIGRNGAGKSTLLKILSRITEPTTGSIALYGRVGSLLEVGTGFHPELTGRENIFLNGAILGMSKSEIARHFDAIVNFAEIENFLDTPVKRYSSGMYVRLAFAVAAHLNPEILVVDEVLAVGDAQFQKKCLGKMEEVGASGRTVLFVSHSMPMVLRLCSQAILLESGRFSLQGSPHEVAAHYISAGGTRSEAVYTSQSKLPGDEVACLQSVRVYDSSGQVGDTFDVRQSVFVEVIYKNLQSELRPTVVLRFTNETGVCLFLTTDYNNLVWWNTPRRPGSVKSICCIPGNFLAEGQVFVQVEIGTHNPTRIHVKVQDAISFQVVDHSNGDGVRGEYVGEWPGVVRPMLKWQVSLQDEVQATNGELTHYGK